MSGVGDRQTLAMPSFESDDDLDDFAPRKSTNGPAVETRRVIDQNSAFPSREASPDAQLNLKGPRNILERFKTMCKEDRRAYYDMLNILMDHYEKR